MTEKARTSPAEASLPSPTAEARPGTGHHKDVGNRGKGEAHSSAPHWADPSLALTLAPLLLPQSRPSPWPSGVGALEGA